MVPAPAVASIARFATQLSQQTGMRVLLPEYRLAPEHPFPAGVDDCFAVYRWMVDQGYPQRPFALAGDSAGGSLSLVTLMRARDALLPLPDCAVLLSPSTDLTMSGAVRAATTPRPTRCSRRPRSDLLPDVYCPGQDRRNPLLSPLFGNWNGLPPLLFHAGSTEMLLDDSVRAHDRAVQAGVEAEIEVLVALPHVFHDDHVAARGAGREPRGRRLHRRAVNAGGRRRSAATASSARSASASMPALSLEHVPAARVLLEIARRTPAACRRSDSRRESSSSNSSVPTWISVGGRPVQVGKDGRHQRIARITGRNVSTRARPAATAGVSITSPRRRTAELLAGQVGPAARTAPARAATAAPVRAGAAPWHRRGRRRPSRRQ